MSAYQQMGHHSENLLFEDELSGYAGAILSPVNYTLADVEGQVRQCVDRLSDYDTIFDPHLYYPNTERGCLDQWSYFPDDFDTADLSSTTWWNEIINRLSETTDRIQPKGLCSPIVIPRVFDDGYYAHLVEIGGLTEDAIRDQTTRAILSVIVELDDLTIEDRPLAIASILSSSQLNEVYLVLLGDREPRREWRDAEGLKGAMRLIAALEEAGIRVITAFSSSDLILWKAAGASSCATGKFFNLRRFTSSRFEEPGSGGGQLPYWFEEALCSFLRESDLLRVRRHSILSDASLENPYLDRIVDCIDAGEPWVGFGWRQYMYWFANAEGRFENGDLEARSLLREAEERWLYLEDENVLMEEPRNDGGWIRPWRRALAEYE